jgi:LAO/AO transport system kinase
MATRGHLGGLASATGYVLTILTAAGKDVILVETVGVGQGEVEVVGAADVSLVVLVPGLGDEVQALKAGIMEIADVFVVNKADRDGADRVVAEIQSLLAIAPEGQRRPAIVQTVATADQGIDELLAAVEAFRVEAGRNGLMARKKRAQIRHQLEEALQERLMHEARARVLTPEETDRIVDRLEARELDPFSAVDEAVNRMGLA